MAERKSKSKSKSKSKPDPTTIQDVRLTFLWAEVVPDFLQQQIANDSPYACLTRSYLYKEAFAKAQTAKTSDSLFVRPWIVKHRQQFWMRYLVQGDLAAVGAEQAWNWLVPLRSNPGIGLTADWFSGRSGVEGFYYPFGVAVMISFQWTPQLAPKALVPGAFQFRKTGKFKITGTEAPESTLDQVAATVLDLMRDRALGKTSLPGLRSSDPFSIVTITRAEAPSKISFNENIRLVLEGLVNWRPDWPDVKLPDPKESCLPTRKSAPAGTALYAQDRGRAIWFPSLFLNKETLGSKLACYHRNLSFASMQTESLSRLVSYTASRFAAGEDINDLTVHHRKAAENSAIQLSKLYVGEKGNTWRSASVQRQIWQNNFEDLKTVLTRFSQPALPPLVYPEIAPCEKT